MFSISWTFTWAPWRGKGEVDKTPTKYPTETKTKNYFKDSVMVQDTFDNFNQYVHDFLAKENPTVDDKEVFFDGLKDFGYTPTDIIELKQLDEQQTKDIDIVEMLLISYDNMEKNDHYFEADMLINYAKNYWLAAEQLVKTQFFKPPFLFSLGHAFELAAKAVLVYKRPTRIKDVRNQYGHNIVNLWKDARVYLSEATMALTLPLIEDYSKIYDGHGDSKFFVRYPSLSHHYGKWPKLISESVNAVANDTSVIIGWMNSNFRDSGRQYYEWPNKSVNWTW
jgi:hypothetical protein